MPKLQKIKRKNLDLEKYSQALNASLNYRIYAEYWYLDLLTNENWECWVDGDYEVIMPIPLQFKFGFKFVIQPIYCQQLGVFYKKEIPDELFREFEKKLHKYFVRSYHFNEENTEKYQPKGEERVNYILDLNRSYEEIYAEYSKKRRKELRKSERLEIKVRETTDYRNFLRITLSDYENLLQYMDESELKKYFNWNLKKGNLVVYDVVDSAGNVLASQICVHSKNRIIGIVFGRNKSIENHNSSAFVNDYLVQKYSNQNMILDFRGSMIPEIAHFMEGFNPEKKQYTHFRNFKF